jgi:hypothetical protein
MTDTHLTAPTRFVEKDAVSGYAVLSSKDQYHHRADSISQN